MYIHGVRAALAPILLNALVTSPARRSLVHRTRHAVMCTGDDPEEGWQPELELVRYRLEGRAQSDSLSESTTDLSDPETWAAQTGLLKERAKRTAAAEDRGERTKRKDVIDALGGLSFGATMLGANWAVKEELLSADTALASLAGLALLAGALGAGELLGNWRGEDVEWRAEQKRLREVKQRRRRKQAGEGTS